VVPNWNIGPFLGSLILFRRSVRLPWTSDQLTTKASTYTQYKQEDKHPFSRYIGYDGVRLTSQNCGLYGPTVHPRVIAMWITV